MFIISVRSFMDGRDGVKLPEDIPQSIFTKCLARSVVLNRHIINYQQQLTGRSQLKLLCFENMSISIDKLK